MSERPACTDKHDPVHFNLKKGHVWICLACGRQLGGKYQVPPEELEALVEFGLHFRENLKNRQRPKPVDPAK